MENNNEKIEIGGLYKIKEGKQLCEVEESVSQYVRVENFLSNPLEKDEWYAEFIYCFKDDLEPAFRIYPYKFLPYDTFLEYFELDMNMHEVNKLIYKLRKEDK